MLNVSEYFDGKVKSVGFDSASTGRASVGVMAEGEYTFGTAQPEEMTQAQKKAAEHCPGGRESRADIQYMPKAIPARAIQQATM